MDRNQTLLINPLKQPSRGVLRKRFLKICSKFTEEHPTPTPTVALHLYWNHTSSWVFSCKFAAFFQNTFSWERVWRAASRPFKIYEQKTKTNMKPEINWYSSIQSSCWKVSTKFTGKDLRWKFLQPSMKILDPVT